MNTGQIVLRVFQTFRDLTLKAQELYLGRELAFLWQRPSMFPSDIPSSVDRWSTSRSSDKIGVLEIGQLCLVCQSDVTGAAVHALVFVHRQAIEADLIEQAVDRAERTEDLAEEAIDRDAGGKREDK